MTVRKASVVVMKNIMGRVLGFGSAAAVGIEPATAASTREDENSLRAQANATQNKFNIAQVEKEILADRSKSKAAEKLAFRLNMKKAAAGGGEPGAVLVGSVNGGELSEAALQALKAEKLKQHKLQEGRRQQSMLVAKERSSNALQKRLDELAAKRKLLPPSEEEEMDSDDSDKENGPADAAREGSGRVKTALGDVSTAGGSGGGVGGSSSRSTLLRKKIIYISDEEEEDLSGGEED